MARVRSLLADGGKPDSMFAPAIEELRKAGRDWSDPISFQDYVSRNFGGKARAKTAEKISVQDLEGLDARLRSERLMVFRLGATANGTTAFALARAPTRIEEYFLIDAEVFSGEAETFVTTSSYHDLFPFQLLGSVVEAGAVNLAIASGLLATALCLDEPAPRFAPATGRTTYTFGVRPHSSFAAAWTHARGQVETDAILFARRAKKWTLFVIEAKHGSGSSLSKVKLAYAASAVATRPVPHDIPIVPVYLRSSESQAGVSFDIAECSLGDPRTSAVSELTVVSSRRFSFPMRFIS